MATEVFKIDCGRIRMKCLEESPYKLGCMEVWGGNRSTAESVDLPGLFGWVYSYPLGPSTGGGDVHYLSV